MLLLLVGCSSVPSDESSLPGEAVPSSVAQASEPPGESPEAARPPTDSATSGVRGGNGTPTGHDRALDPKEAKPEGGTPSVQGGGTPDEWDAKMRATGTRLIAGSTDRAEWRLYGWNEGNDICLEFHVMGKTVPSGGSGTMCKQRPPLDTSGANGPEGRFFFGLVDARAASVRVEHRDGATHTYTTVAVSGFRVRFYAGPASPTPVARVVALDGAGRMLAERKDPESLNTKT